MESDKPEGEDNAMAGEDLDSSGFERQIQFKALCGFLESVVESKDKPTRVRKLEKFLDNVREVASKGETNYLIISYLTS